MTKLGKTLGEKLGKTVCSFRKEINEELHVTLNINHNPVT
jgi:hypothetical protein